MTDKQRIYLSPPLIHNVSTYHPHSYTGKKDLCVPPLATLTLMLALSLPGLASADVYKCPTPDGKTIYQDAPCSVEAAPIVESKTPSVPITDSEQVCQGFGALAYTIAIARNRGGSFTEVLAVARTSFHGSTYTPAQQEKLGETLQALALQIYEQSWLRPLQAKHMAEVSCHKALLTLPAPTLQGPSTTQY